MPVDQLRLHKSISAVSHNQGISTILALVLGLLPCCVAGVGQSFEALSNSTWASRVWSTPAQHSSILRTRNTYTLYIIHLNSHRLASCNTFVQTPVPTCSPFPFPS